MIHLNKKRLMSNLRFKTKKINLIKTSKTIKMRKNHKIQMILRLRLLRKQRKSNLAV